MAEEESKSIPHDLPSSHWLKATGQCVLERYLSATMLRHLINEADDVESASSIFMMKGCLRLVINELSL